MRVEIKFMTSFPHIQLINLAFLEMPFIDFQLRPLGGGDLNSIGSLNSFIQNILDSSLKSFLVLPNCMPLNIEEMMNGGGSPLETPIGILRVIVCEAKGLRNADIGSLSDPVACIKLGGVVVAKTRVIDNELNPKWNQSFNIVIYRSTLEHVANNSDQLVIEIQHENKLQSILLGRTEALKLHRWIKLLHHSSLESDESAPLSAEERESLLKQWGSPLYDVTETWLPLLENDKPSKASVKIDLAFFPLDTLYIDEPRKIRSHAGILQVSISQAKDLKKLAHPLCAVDMAGLPICKTHIRKKTNNPVWDFKHVYYCHNVDEAKLRFQVIDDMKAIPGIRIPGEEIKSLGQCVINVRDAIKKGDEWYQLFSGQGKIKVAFKFTPIDLSQSLIDKSLIRRREPVGVIRVHIIEAKGLANVELLGKSDPYTKVSIGHKLIGITQAIENTLDPEWRETFMGIPYDWDDTLSLELFDYNELQKDKWLGKFSLHLGFLFELIDKQRFGYNADASRRNLLENYIADGFEAKIKEGSSTTLSVWVPIYISKHDLDISSAGNTPNGSQNQLNIHTESLLKSATALGKEIGWGGKGKIRQKGKVHFEIDFFPVYEPIIRPEFPVPGSGSSPRSAIPPSGATSAAPISARQSHVASARPSNVGSAQPCSAQPPNISEKPGDLVFEGIAGQSQTNLLESGNLIELIDETEPEEPTFIDPAQVISEHKMGILRIRFEQGVFNRKCAPYVEVLKNGKSIFRTRSYYEKTRLPEWNDGTDKFLDQMDSSVFEVIVKDQRGEEPSAGDIIMGVWKGDIALLLGKASYKLSLKQYSISPFPQEQLPVIGYIYASFGYSPVEVNVDLSTENGILYLFRFWCTEY